MKNEILRAPEGLRQSHGATTAEWKHFATTLGLEDDLLPCAVDPDAKWSERSNIKTPGKVPSDYNSRGLARGMMKWPSHVDTARDVAGWAKQDLGICVITRHVRAIDVDVADPAISGAIRDVVELTLGALPYYGLAMAALTLPMTARHVWLREKGLELMADDALNEVRI